MDIVMISTQHNDFCESMAYIAKANKEMMDNLIYPPVILSNQQAADLALEAAGDFFAPTTTCTSLNQVPCQQGNNPMYIEDMCPCVSADPWAPKKKPTPTSAAAGAAVAALTINAAPDTAQDQRKYLSERVYSIKYTKNNEIAKQFHREAPDAPKTVKELEERLKKGLYTVEKPKGYDDDEEDFYWRDLFSWRTPDTQFDKAGYDAAHKELDLFIEDIQDQIKILDPKDGLALLAKLKEWKPTAKAHK
jgi:hypothetical protein